mgnify:CR=1 FL=1
MLGFDEPIRAVIIGATGGIGDAFVRAITQDDANQVWATARNTASLRTQPTHASQVDITDEDSLVRLARELSEVDYHPNFIINCTGVLHTREFGPERTWRHFDIDVMRSVFDVNAFGVGLIGKHLIPLVPRSGRSVFASISARVGSIADNRLGGWYSYRASKAAQNMFIKGLSIEAKMRWPELACVALHPGTVQSQLSAPFTSRVPAEKLFTPEQSCTYLCTVIEALKPADSGNFYAWDGQPIPF